MTTTDLDLEPRHYAGHTLYYVKVGEGTEAVLRPWASAQRMKLEEALAAIIRGAAQGLAEKQAQQPTAGAKPTPPSPAPKPTPAPSPPTGETALAEAPTAAERERRLAIADRDLRLMEQAYGRATERGDSWEAKFKTERGLRDDAEERAGHATQAVAELQAKLEDASATIGRLQSLSAPEFVVSERGVQMRIFVPAAIADRLVSSPEVSIPDTDTPPLPTPSTPEPPAPEPGPDVLPSTALSIAQSGGTGGQWLRDQASYWDTAIVPRRCALALIPFLEPERSLTREGTIRDLHNRQRALLARLRQAYDSGYLPKAARDRLVALVPGLTPYLHDPGVLTTLTWSDVDAAVRRLTLWTPEALRFEPRRRPDTLNDDRHDETPALAEAEAPVPGPVPAAPVPTPRAPLSAPTPVSLPALAPYVNPNPERRPYVRLGPREAELLALVEAGYTDEEICAHVGCPPASWRGFRKNTLGRSPNPPHAVTSAP